VGHPVPQVLQRGSEEAGDLGFAAVISLAGQTLADHSLADQ
jgi:hypothetical protein